MRQIRRVLCYALLTVVCAAAALAEEYQLSLAEALRLALDSSLVLQAEDLKLGVKQRSRDTVWNSFVPRMGLTGTLSRMNEAPAPPAAHTWNVSAGFSAQLDLSLALFQGIRGTVLDYEAGRIDREAAEARLRRDVKKAYFNLIVLQESRSILEQSIDTAAKRLEQAQRNYQAGIGSEFDLLSAQVAWENLKPGLEDLRVGQKTAELAFKQLLGLQSSDTFSLTDPLRVEALELDAQSLIRERVSYRSDIRALRQAIALQKSALGLQRALAFTPVLTLRFTLDPTFTGDPFRDAWFQDVSGQWIQPMGMFAVNLSMPLDGLLPSSASRVKIANMGDGIAELEKTLALGIQGAELEIESLVLQLEKARTALEALELNVRLAQKAYEMAEKGFATGALERLEVEEADNGLSSARYQVLRETYGYITTLLDLEYAINQALL